MSIVSFFKGLKKSASEEKHPSYSYKVDSDFIYFIVDQEHIRSIEQGVVTYPLLAHQHILLTSLNEQGGSSKIANGYEIRADVFTSLDESFYAAFDLPDFFDGQINVRFNKRTYDSSFTAKAEIVLSNGDRVLHYELKGPTLKLSASEEFLLNNADWCALKAITIHGSLTSEEKTEFRNNQLIHELQIARNNRCNINLAQFSDIEFIAPEKVGLSIQEAPNGDLVLSPSFGQSVPQSMTENRLGQLRVDQNEMIFKAGNSFVLLDEKRLNAAKEVISNRKIPKEQVAQFFKTPTAFLDAAVIDLDTGFSMRVKGAEKFQHAYFGDVEESGVDWFGNGQPTEKAELVSNLCGLLTDIDSIRDFEDKVKSAAAVGAEEIQFEGLNIDISDKVAIEEAIDKSKKQLAEHKNIESPSPDPIDETLSTSVVAIDTNDDDIEFEQLTESVNQIGFSEVIFDESNLKRTPYPHQREGIQWLLGLMGAGHFNNLENISGGLLADDMGLGKSFMTLVSMHEYMKQVKKQGLQEKPYLLVAPLSLLENWKDEIEQTFHASPFFDVVILQGAADLKRFKVRGAGKETLQEVDGETTLSEGEIRYSLKVGKTYGQDRLDMPNRFVLVTYNALRDYQFSLSRIDWAIAAFDEAQNLKNPNALVSRAAKGLKADFKLLATGTPVENSLKDFWCLMDTAVPGLLGAWQTFRSDYISPILEAGDDYEAIQQQVGTELRSAVGSYMLRRTKEDSLSGLPPKKLWVGDQALGEFNQQYHFNDKLTGTMSGAQQTAYDDLIQEVHDAEDKRAVVLKNLVKMRTACIHHAISHFKPGASDLKTSLAASCKMTSLLAVLDEIKTRDEKVIIFATTKTIQSYLSFALGSVYGLAINIVNGEMKAVSNNQGVETRKSILKEFEAKPGFNIVIMSPVAAGVGLTVVGANNVIHLERHWNPAKEAQATDRVYRIGQKKEVNVYFPIAKHPSIPTFDQQLARLLQKKTCLSDAVIAQPDLSEEFASMLV